MGKRRVSVKRAQTPPSSLQSTPKHSQNGGGSVSGGSGFFGKERLTSRDTGAKGELPDLKALSALKLNGTPVIHYINKDAAQLLTQAKNLEEFEVASCVFWGAVFANQRGFKANLRGAIIETYVYPALWNEDGCLYKIFEDVYEKYMHHFIEKVLQYSTKWIESDAGKKHLELIGAARRHKAKKPESLRGEDILSIKVIENENEVEYKGISWTIADMCQFWEPLLDLVEPEICDDKVRWMRADSDVSAPSSWLKKLGSVALTVIAIVASKDIQAIGQKNQIHNGNYVSEALASVPTPTICNKERDDGLLIPFPLMKFGIHQWIQYFKENNYPAFTKDRTSAREISNLNLTQADNLLIEEETLEDEILLKEEAKKDVRDKSEQLEKAFDDMLVSQLTKSGLDMSNFDSTTMPSLSSFPPAHVYAFASPLAQELTSLNIWGKGMLIRKLMEEKILHYKTLGMLSIMKRKQLEAELRKLDEVERRMAEAEAAEEEFEHRLGQLRGTIKSRQKSIASRSAKRQATSRLSGSIDPTDLSDSDKQTPLAHKKNKQQFEESSFMDVEGFEPFDVERDASSFSRAHVQASREGYEIEKRSLAAVNRRLGPTDSSNEARRSASKLFRSTSDVQTAAENLSFESVEDEKGREESEKGESSEAESSVEGVSEDEDVTDKH